MLTNLNFGKLIQSFISNERNEIKSSVLAANLPGTVLPSIRTSKKKIKTGDNIFQSLLSLNSGKSNSTFFIKGICAGIHSIDFDNSGFMYIGSLGNNSAEVGKRGLKNIIKIDSHGNASKIAEIDCQFITALTSNLKGILYIATLENQKGKLYKINNNGSVEEIASGFAEISSIKIDSAENIIVGSDKIYIINQSGERKVLIPDSGTVDFDSDTKNLFIGSLDGNELFCYPVEDRKSCTANKIFEGLKGIKCIALSPNGKVVVLSFDEKDIITIIEKNKIVQQIYINIELPLIYLPRRYILSNMAIGKKGFDENAVYITTWTGDIIRVRLNVNLVSAGN